MYLYIIIETVFFNNILFYIIDDFAVKIFFKYSTKIVIYTKCYIIIIVLFNKTLHYFIFIEKIRI